MLTAITRAVSPAFVRCELSFMDRKPIDLARAREQHRAYEVLLAKLGARVISLSPEPDLPDSMFVEDPAIVLDELAVIFPLGTETRRREAPSLAQEVAKYRKLAYVQLPGTLEGGDVLRIGRKLFVGLTKRSNAEGIRQLAEIVGPHGYEVIPVPVTGCLHLKSAVTWIGENTLLANRAWFDASGTGQRPSATAPGEPDPPLRRERRALRARGGGREVEVLPDAVAEGGVGRVAAAGGARHGGVGRGGERPGEAEDALR